jgi:hypothetical protein
MPIAISSGGRISVPMLMSLPHNTITPVVHTVPATTQASGRNTPRLVRNSKMSTTTTNASDSGTKRSRSCSMSFAPLTLSVCTPVIAKRSGGPAAATASRTCPSRSRAMNSLSLMGSYSTRMLVAVPAASTRLPT